MSIESKWNPWEESQQGAPLAVNRYNTMAGPPCSNCRFWKPQVKFIHTELGFVYDGIRCCHAREMEADFSCFKDAEVK